MGRPPKTCHLGTFERRLALARLTQVAGGVDREFRGHREQLCYI